MINRKQAFMKRFFDASFAMLGLVILSPFYLIITLTLWIHGERPIFFKQKRVGYKGKDFTIYKFRTLPTATEDDGPRLIADLDSRNTTKIELFLRAHHLDELPQFWNVLRGDISFVGPRPERKFFIDKIKKQTDRYNIIYNMRPGLTSKATLYNGYTDSIEKMIYRMEMDIYYWEHFSLWEDCKIIAETVINIVIGKKF